MRYWWVNQNQTYRHEVAGGYLWSPKRNANGARNPFYETMREVSPGDTIFSFADTRIAAIGVAQSYCWESPKPQEFGTAGQYWENVGWKVRVQFTELLHRIRPKEHMDVLRSLLPPRYSPLQPSGNGIQSIYLTEIPTTFAEVLAGLIGAEANMMLAGASQNVAGVSNPLPNGDDLDYWEHRLEEAVAQDAKIPEGQAATVARDLLRIANAGQPNPQRCDPSVPGMLSQEDFVQDVRKLTWKVMGILTDTANMAPRARLKFLRRQLRNRGRSFQLLAQAQVVDRAALLVMIERACPPQVPAPSAAPSKTIPIENLADQQASDSSRVSRRRLILNVGRDRVVFDFVSRLTVLEPGTGNAPAKVVTFTPRSRRKSN